MNAAEKCRAEGWGVGTVLQWKGSRIRITATCSRPANHSRATRLHV